MKRRRILVQLPSFDSGGAENYALRLVKHAGNTEFEWHVTSGNLRNARLEDAFRQEGAKVHHASPGFGDPRQMQSFFRFLRHHDFDAITTLTGVFGGLALSLARLAGLPCRVAWHRRSTPAYTPTLGRRAHARVSLTLLEWGSTRILSNSRAALDNHHGPDWMKSRKFKVIPNGVDANRYCLRPELRSEVRAEFGILEHERLIGHIGRLDPAKDHETLLAVVARLRRQCEGVRLLLAGSGTDSAEFGLQLEHAGLRDITLALGNCPDVYRLYNAMDFFFFPSVTEGQPNALIEAMHCGLPIVASDIPGIREAIPPTLMTKLFPPRDVSAATNLLESVLSNPSSAQASIGWARDRYDLCRNLDMALRELHPTEISIAHA